jgi:hypothetical protein
VSDTYYNYYQIITIFLTVRYNEVLLYFLLVVVVNTEAASEKKLMTT